MSDVLDNMQERMALLDEMQAQALLASAQQSTCESARECGCGNAIPEKRRRALPGVTTCVDCQSAREKGLKCMGISPTRRLAGA
jgi:phage/conjugal plasmid C-4 type zinc finger TraR family protein